MPTLDWLDRQAAFQVAAHTPTHVLRPHAAGHIYGDAASARDNLLIQGDNLKRPGFRGGSNTGEWSHEEVLEVFA
ncbi:MAG: Site-specific DNA-methyltransferase [Pseudomonadota bacterium]|nr:Site-specific DNA-methyltransferase [Pseudomonadota bacterium]